MLSGEVTQIPILVFGLTRPGLEPTIYRTRGEHANHYATDAVTTVYMNPKNCVRVSKYVHTVSPEYIIKQPLDQFGVTGSL